MESKGGPAGVFPHSKYKPSSISISQQSQDAGVATTTTTTLQAPLTPRIDISRASSSSYHEDSSPENVFDQVGTGTLQESTGCLELFQEDVDELRSSTEELFFMEKEKGQTECEKPLASATQVSRAPMIFKFDDSQALQQFNQYNQRKDSQCSEVADLLNPMGRTSRISSVGSQGSAVSRLSGQSGISRSPSPHKMMVETSFCGPKPIEPTSDASSIEHLTQDIENVILARRGDPTRAALAEGVEIREPRKTTKEKLMHDIPTVTTMTPAETARAAAKEARRKEIEALKVRLNAINQRQLEKSKGGGATSGTVKKVIGVTPEGTEYTRIKLKADHLYEDHGVSPNEKIIEEKEFQDPLERKREHKKKAEEPKKSPGATDNRSPSPASASVSRKSSFCNFFKSNKDDTSKAKPSSAGSKSGGKLDKSPLPSPSKSSFSSRVAFSFFKTNRNASPSQLETATPKQQSHSKPQQPAQGQKDKPRLRYYDAPDVIHIPLHTPPEEKEFTALKKKTEEKKEKEVIQVAPVTVHQQQEKLKQSPPDPPPPKKPLPKKAPTAQIEKMQSTDEIELHEVPHHHPRPPPPLPPTRKISEDIQTEGGSSLWSIEVQRHSSQESQETVISSQPSKTLENGSSSNNNNEKPMLPTYIDTIDENQVMTQQQQQQPNNNQQRPRNKKHILFCTKIGSGSEEQIFSTQLSLSKTESQSSQLSEQAGSVFESPKNEECGTKMPDVTPQRQSSSEIEKVVTATSVRSRSDQSDSGSAAGSRPPSATRNSRVHQRSSGEFSAKKRESSDELLHKSSPQVQQPSPSYDIPQHHTSIVKQSDSSTKILQHQSSGSRMEISSESDRESDIDGCIHKRVSRLMEDNESTGLVLQESFDDELPYVPTTLPEERSCGIKIVPTRERTQTELITIPVERPRSTTPIAPASLDDFCERKQSDASDISLIRGEKLRISLPRHKAEQTKESIQQKSITRRISNLSNKSWTEFAEQGLQNTSAATPTAKKPEKSRKQSNSSQDDEPLPPPPPPATVVKSHSKKSLTSKWIDFENIPEKRQPPKKITTIPMSKGSPSEKIHNSSKHSHHHQRQFTYVSPEECQCECHETKKDSEGGTTTGGSGCEKQESPSDDSQPLLDDNAERNSTISTDSSIDLDCSLENDDANYVLQQSSTLQLPAQQSGGGNSSKPFGMDLSVEFGGHSNRSSVVSPQEMKSPSDLALHK